MFTISYDAQWAASGATRRETSLSIIQSVMNSGWFGPRKTLVSGRTSARTRAASAAGKSNARIRSSGSTPKRTAGPSARISNGEGVGSR